MASFRTGFKIFGEISLKQGLGRIRSFSEDRKPGQWLPEDQWAVRQPGCTCPDKREKQKPPKASKSWLSLCKDPEPPLECDIRHNNCPPPPVAKEGPWYSLDNLLPKKKPQEKIPPLCSCREEMRKCEKEEVGESEIDCKIVVEKKPETDCMSKPDPCPAPVISLPSPLPKELDIMLWCGKPSKDTTRIAAKCLSDRLPFQEFRPQKMWKPPPFQIPTKCDLPTPTANPCCYSGSVAFSEFKQVELPRPLYTRYKSVELCDENFLLCMTDATCPDNKSDPCTATNENPPPCADPPSSPPPTSSIPPEPPKQIAKSKKECYEKEFIEAASCKPVRIKKAPKYIFRPKPTKLVEKKVKHQLAMHKCSDLNSRTEKDVNENDCTEKSNLCKTPIGNCDDEPPVIEKDHILPQGPPTWMSVLSMPGSENCTTKEELPKEPDWSSETDGLKFYDGDNKGIIPKPPPDPYLALSSKGQVKETKAKHPCDECREPETDYKNKFVLMPDRYNIKRKETLEEQLLNEKKEEKDSCETFETFIQTNTPQTISQKSLQPMKENILYDLQRLCPNAPVDPSKVTATCRRVPDKECPPVKFYRSFSTFSSPKLPNSNAFQLCKMQCRSECGDSSGKCKLRPRAFRPQKECKEKAKLPNCAEIQLPCCPKARIPPQCNLRRPQPPCRRKLPPKPSFSECSKDPLPCPRLTECNCWERKNGKNGNNHLD